MGSGGSKVQNTVKSVENTTGNKNIQDNPTPQSSSSSSPQKDSKSITLPPISVANTANNTSPVVTPGQSGIAAPPPITNTSQSNASGNIPSGDSNTTPLPLVNSAAVEQNKPPPQTESGTLEKLPSSGQSSAQTSETSDTMATAKNDVEKTSKNENDRIIPLEPEDQRRFDDVISTACLLVKPESLLKRVTKNVTKLELNRALPRNFDLYSLLSKLTALQEVDISNNDIGPEGFRSVCLAMCSNVSIHSLNMANNKADTDSAECVGRMITDNKTLLYLDISSNYLGKDYFSRCVGPALKVNKTLQTLRAESIGSTDVKVFFEGLQENNTLTELAFSKNPVRDPSFLGKSLAQILKKPDCCLQSLALSYCEMTWQGIEALQEALRENSSLCELNLNGNSIGSLTNLLSLVVSAACNPTLTILCADSVGIKDTTVKAADVKPHTGKESVLQIVSLNDTHLTNEFFSVLADKLNGQVLPLTDLDIGVNEDLTSQCVSSIVKLTTGEECPSPLRRLSFSLNSNIADLPDLLVQRSFPGLQYLKVNRCKIPEVHKLSPLFTSPDSCLNTLVLDGLKIANTDALQKLLGKTSPCSLHSLSIGGCSLAPTDIVPLCEALKKGFPLQMLKISANRLGDQGVADIVEALLSNKTHPLSVLDISTNVFGDPGAKSLASLFSNKKHKSQIHSLNVSTNNIRKEGLLSLVSIIGGKFPLRTLYLQNQSAGLDEPEMIEIYTNLATSLGFTIKKGGDVIKPGCSDLPTLPDGFVIKMTGLGGNTGDIGRMLDSVRLHTDHVLEQLPTLTFEDVQVLCAVLKGTGSDTCIWSMEDWKMITGANRATTETPSWLELESSRALAVYLGNLPGNTTQQKMEGMLEMDADCNLDEICLMKDPVTRANNGVGWVLMCDKESVEKAIDFYNKGEAKVFGQAFSMSRVKVKIDDQEDAKAAAKAREDLEDRLKLKKKLEQEHRSLIQRKTEEQWKRHAYRLAHPAYADGRIW